MKRTTRSQVLAVSIALFILLGLSRHLFPYIIANESDNTYENTKENSDLMRGDIANGAGAFLKSQADFIELLNRVEVSDANGIDFKELETLLDQSILHLETARDYYINLIQKAEATNYNTTILEKLAGFDYTGFRQARRLNGEIFQKVEALLSVGDTRGVYDALLTETNQVLDQLATIKADINLQVFPNLSTLWRTNQAYSETVLFGQYVAEVFFEITGK